MSSASKVSLSAVRLLVVGAFAAFVALAGMWSLPPLDRDEARFAQATVQMLESGDYVSIRYQDRERNKKPAGIHWLQAASVHFLSDVEAREIWAYRIPSMIGVILASIFVFMIAQKLYDQRTAFLAGLLFASAPVIAAEATIAKTDGVLLAMICLAQWAFVEIYARSLYRRRKSGWGWPTAILGRQRHRHVLIKGTDWPTYYIPDGPRPHCRQTAPRLGLADASSQRLSVFHRDHSAMAGCDRARHRRPVFHGGHWRRYAW